MKMCGGFPTEDGADEDGAPTAESVGEDAADQGSEDGTPEERADDDLDDLVRDGEALLDQPLSPGYHAHIEPEEQACEGGGESDEVDNRAEFCGRGGGSVHQ